MRPVPVGLNPDDLVAFLSDVYDAVSALQNPQGPVLLWRVASTKLPRPASAFTGCYVDLTDFDTAAKSNGTNWVRIDTGGVL